MATPPERLGPRDQLLLTTALAGNTFMDQFYSIWDSNREELHGSFFRDNSIIVWDGNAAMDAATSKHMCKALPSTKHKIITLDSQPIGVPDEAAMQINDLQKSLMVVVTGDVKYGILPNIHSFHHTFVLDKDPQNLEYSYIVSWTCRHTSERPDTADIPNGKGSKSDGRAASNSRGNGRR